MRFRLSDADRERYGCEEWLSVDLDATTNKEAATLQRALGFDDHVTLADAFNAQWRTDETGGARMNYGAWDAVVWLSLRQAGVLTARSREEMAAELDGLHYEVVRLRVRGADSTEEVGE